MNFFKSVFAEDDPEPNQPSSPPESEPEPETPATWGFMGGLMKTIATKSESVIETYRRDLEEFSSGLKLETQVFKEVASSSLEVGASKAQESLESVGHAIDTLGSVVWNSTAQIISHESDSDLDNPTPNPDLRLNSDEMGRKYSRYEAQLRGIQCDVSTYVEEFEDEGEFEKWKLGFDLGEKSGEIEELIRENVNVEGIYKKVVPNLVDHDNFWLRYFFRVFKLEQAESVRAKLVERANVDEDLSWDVDDDDDNDNDNDEKEENPKHDDHEEVKLKEEVEVVEEKKTPSEGSKDSDITVVSTQPSPGEEEEEDLGWDEIEDIGSDDDDDDEKKGKKIEGNKEELRKRLSVAEDDEDLSWDIEDDDEPINKS